MKRSILLSATLATLLLLSSCSDDNNNSNNGFGGISASIPTGVHTNTSNDYDYWKAIPDIVFENLGGNNYNYWSLKVHDYSGYLQDYSSNQTYFKGYISYVEKDKYCNDVVHLDSLRLEITQNESGTAQITFIVTAYNYPEGSYPSSSGATQNIYFIRPATAGNINVLNVYDVSNTYQFGFKTSANNNYNSWKFVSIPDNWMSSEGKMCLMIVPVFYTVLQL